MISCAATRSRRTEEVPIEFKCTFLVQQQELEDFSAKQEKANKLAKLLASMVGAQDIVS